LGLVNTFLKRLVNKGYFKVKTMPRNRVKYFLTPEGLARKSRLTVEYLRYSMNFYQDVKKLLLSTYREMEDARVRSLLFRGAGEVAELAYLYLRLTEIELVGIVDETRAGKPFFEHVISGVDRLGKGDWDKVLLTRLDTIEKDVKDLIDLGIQQHRIATL
jgi:hypothetical protein